MNRQERLYLDWNASAPLLPAARAAMVEALALAGNPSSVHAEGRALRKLAEEARATIAGLMEVAPKQVIFTSGATEAAALALSPVLKSGTGEMRFSRLYVSAIEHPCVLAGGRFAPEAVETLPARADGLVDLTALEAALARHDAAEGAPMVALMAANNETGAIQPIEKAAAIVHACGGVLVVDAAQGFGRMDVRPAAMGADFVLLSAHKIGGPAGCGALVCGHAGLLPQPLLRGGGQENHNRAGTENVAAIAGFAAAAGAADIHAWVRVAGLRDLVEAGLDTICRAVGLPAPAVFARDVPRLANTSCFALPGVAAEMALIGLDLAGIAVSSGSACSSGKVKSSHVLKAMGVGDELARCALRMSLRTDSTESEARRFLAACEAIVARTAASRAA